MLVLARRESERLLFPTLDITIEVLRIQGGIARLGIDAPDDIPVVREEIADLKSLDFATDEPTAKLRLALLSHAVRGRLKSATTMLNRVHELLESNQVAAAQKAVLEAYRELHHLDGEALNAIEELTTAHHLLLVASQSDERELLAGYLRKSGFEVTVSPSPTDALSYLSLHAVPDLLLLDLPPGDSKGPAMIHAIRSNRSLSHLKLLALTHRNPQPWPGIDRSFERPLDPERLVEEMTRMLGTAA